jgi:hypothetical protein
MDQGIKDLLPILVGLLSLMGLSIVFRINLLVQQIQMHTSKLMTIAQSADKDDWEEQPSEAFIERLMDSLEQHNPGLHKRFGAMCVEIDQLFLQYHYEHHLLVGFRVIFGALVLLALVFIFKLEAAAPWKILTAVAVAISGGFLLFSTRHISSWKKEWAPFSDRWDKLSNRLRHDLPEAALDRKTSSAPVGIPN